MTPKAPGHTRVISINVNGIRATARKGFFDWLPDQDADVVCLQEVRAHADQITDPIFHPEGFHEIFVSGERRGYSGVAIYSKAKPDELIDTLGYPLSDAEGRYVAARFGKVTIASLYLPSGTSGDIRQQEKYGFMDFYIDYLQGVKDRGEAMIIAGDWNIAHTQKDIKNWKANQKNSGFLPEERAWLDTLFHEKRFVDTFRVCNQEEDQYTWWSQRGKARANNVGWRIDYQVATPNLQSAVKQVGIDNSIWFSDHAPLIVDYDLSQSIE